MQRDQLSLVESQILESHARIKAMIGSSGLFLDAPSKSLRGYTTRVHPMILERLKYHYRDLFPRGIIKIGKTFTYDQDNAFTGSNVVNRFLQPFYDQELRVGMETDIIYPKISSKTLLKNEAATLTMRREIEDWIGDHTSSSRGCTTFRDLACEELGTRVVESLLDDFNHSFLAFDILEFLSSHSWCFPASSSLVVRGRKSNDPLLIMKCKYYVSRDDNRAYCQDKSRLRQLVGSCLHRLLLPKNVFIRKKLHSNQFIPAVDKDKLDLIVPNRGQRYDTYLILGDVSNFTGSLGNSWALLFAIALELSGNLPSSCSLFNVGGHFILGYWKDIIILYLYLTVGVKCYVEDLDAFESLPGGFLGVAANITTGLSFLSLFLAYTTRLLLPRVIDTTCQAGGDDFAFLINVRKGDGNNILAWLESEFNTYVGQVKEFKAFELSSHHPGIIDGAYFCRKRVMLRKCHSRYVIGYEPSCPIHESLLPSSQIVRMDLQVKAWTELDLGLAMYEKQCPQMIDFTDSLRQVFLDNHPRVFPRRYSVKRHCPFIGFCGRIVGDDVFTEDAFKRIQSVEAWDEHYYIALATFRSKVRHCLVLEEIVTFKAMYGGTLRTIYLTKGEEGLLTTERAFEEVRITHLGQVYSDLRNLLKT